MQDERFSKLDSLAGLIFLTAAHLITLAALVSFAGRSGGYPLSPPGLATYGAMSLLAALGLVILVGQRSNLDSTNLSVLLLITLPTLAAFIFWLGLGGMYPPYDYHDTDLVRLFFPAFAFILTVTGILYGSLLYLLMTAVLQMSLYLFLYWPQYQQYDGASIFGPQPDIFVILVGIYLIGVLLALVRKATLDKRTIDLKWGTMLMSVAGGLFMHQMLSWLPQNEAYLGYLSQGLYVPSHAWNWLRSFATFLALGTVAAGVVSFVYHLLRRVHVPERTATT